MSGKLTTGKLATMLDGMTRYDQGGILTEGSIARALEMYTASNPRWQYCRFADLPRPIQFQVLDLAAFVEAT